MRWNAIAPIKNKLGPKADVTVSILYRLDNHFVEFALLPWFCALNSHLIAINATQPYASLFQVSYDNHLNIGPRKILEKP